MTLDELVSQYADILEEKEELETKLKGVKALKEAREQEICERMVEEEKPDTTYKGYKYSLTQKTEYSKLSEQALAEKGINFIDVIEECGLRHILSVNARTLNSTCKHIVEEEEELPEALKECVSEYEKLGISRRKAKTDALNRAKANR